MKKVLYTNFEDIGSVVQKLLGSKELKKAITRNNLYKFWAKVVDKKLSDKSKPYGMLGGGVMIIACQNAMVAQELVLRKAQILEKFQPYLKSLHMKVTDIKFDCKKWEVEKED